MRAESAALAERPAAGGGDSVPSIEYLMIAFDALPLASERCWHVREVMDRRLYLSRGERGEYALFLPGNRESFGELPPLPGVEHRSDVVVLPERMTAAMLRLASADPVHGRRIMAHVAYEVASRLHAEPAITNRALLAQVGWVLVLLGEGDREPLSRERQKGLLGECLFLRRLLQRAVAHGLARHEVLTRWFGHLPAKRDFAAQGIAVEVKTTGAASRQHEIGSVDQLDAQGPGEAVFVFSVGVRADASAPRKLPVFVDDVMELLVADDGTPDLEARRVFLEKLVGYGYDPTDRARYEAEPGFLSPHLPGALFAETQLDRLRFSSFVAGQPPETVMSIRYTLEIRADPLDITAATAVLDKLLLAPAL